MNQERIHALEELGMVWSMCDHVDWEERLEELRQYKQKYGDCLVPNKFPQNPQLGRYFCHPCATPHTCNSAHITHFYPCYTRYQERGLTNRELNTNV